MKKNITLSVMLLLAVLAACSSPRQDLTSPCVGTDDSPCGPHRPVNEWWLKNHTSDQS